MINESRWKQAQQSEIGYQVHHESGRDPFEHYKTVYTEKYFKYLDIDATKTHESILEIGPATVAGCEFVDAKKKTIIEPLFTEEMLESHPNLVQHKNRIESNGVEIAATPAENFDDYDSYEEVWLMNVLQHVMSPSKILEKCRGAKKVRFFEPINLPTDSAHPHTLTADLFIDSLFKNSTGDGWHKVYEGGSTQGFHGATCYYGVWEKN